MNYVDIFNCLKNNGTNTYTTWYNDDNPMKKTIDDTVRSIWYSDGKQEIQVKEEKKNGKTESQHPDDGCIYW